MARLTEDVRKALGAALRERREQLWGELGARLHHEGHEALAQRYDGAHDRGDESVADVLADIEIALASSEAAELGEIERALLRLRSDTYGACVDCGVDIPPARLEAEPAAARCIACQAALELSKSASGKDPTPSL